jgi:hypothetical protein
MEASMSDGDKKSPRSDLEDGVQHISQVMGGVLTRLLGEKVTGVPLDRDKPTVSADADKAIEDAGEKVGRFLHAVGKGLRHHPDDPSKAWEEAREHPEEPHPVEGETALTEGVRAFAGGVLKTTEKALDRIVQRRTKEPSGEE